MMQSGFDLLGVAEVALGGRGGDMVERRHPGS